MTRLSKQGERRNVSPKRPRLPGVKTGSKKDKLKLGYKEHSNAIAGEIASSCFIGKIKTV